MLYLPEVTITGGTNTSYTGGTANDGGTNSGYQGGSYDGGTNTVTYSTLTPDQFKGYQSKDSKGCYRRCSEMLSEGGATPNGGRISMTEVGHGVVAGATTQNAVDGINAIDTALSAGQPIIVGVDYKPANYNDGVTDHFIVIAGSTTTINSDGSSTTTYNFYDPATSNQREGTSSSNILTLDNNSLTGSFGSNNYTVTTVRTNQ